jgi:hypothetical protein
MTQAASNTYQDLSIVIPAFNEEKGIAAVLEDLKRTMPEAEVIVVDDGSSDGTVAAVLKHATPGFPLTLMSHPFNQGYGSSLVTGMRTATRTYVAWFDADNEHRVEDLQDMVRRARAERLVAVIGQRPASVSTFRAAGKGLILLLTRALNIKAGRDLNCGLRVFRRDVILSYLPLLPARYSASLTTTILMVERGYPTAFHPIQTAPRLGTSKVRIRDGFLAMAKVMNLITLFAPMRIFFRGGLLLSTVGLLYGTFVALREPLGFPVAGLLLILAGFLLAVLGLLAEQIGQMRLGVLGAIRPAHRLYPKQDDHGDGGGDA